MAKVEQIIMAGKPQNTKKVSLEELLALNDEITALVRAGVPLEFGLTELGEDRLGRLGARLATRLSQGESLPEALAHDDIGVPRTYRVIVEAGIKAGRLTAALEGVSRMARKMADLRRNIGLALVYPLIVVMLAYGLFLLLCTSIVPRMRYIFDDLGLRAGFFDLLEDFGRYANPWGWVFPILILLLIIWWRQAGRRGFLAEDGSPSWMAWCCPGVGKVMKFYRYAQFADLLALLVEQNVPLHEATQLAAETTNDAAIQEAARAIALNNMQGTMFGSKTMRSAEFPPFLHWLITRREEQQGMVSALRAASEMYSRRAELITNWIKVAFPVLAAVVLGGGATLCYTLTIFLPVTELLHELARPLI